MSQTKVPKLTHPGSEYMWECLACYMNRGNRPNQTYASYSTDYVVVRRSAKEHHRETGHEVMVCVKQVVEVVGEVKKTPT